MAGNKEILDFSLVPSPVNGDIYIVKADTDYRVRVGVANGLPYLDSTAQVPISLLPAIDWGYLTGTITNQADLMAEFDGKSNIDHIHSAGDITSGVLAPARLGTGTPSISTYLRGDGAWAPAPYTGTVTSVAISGGTTGLTASGGPITSAGTLTLGGTLALANGGTGATTAAAARTNLGAAATSHTHDAADVTSGTFNALRIPNLDASKTTTGIFDAARIPNLAASKITSGILSTARLGTGTADATTYLRGDGTWATVAGGGSGTVTSVQASGGTTGMSFSGGPVTSSGTLTLAGTLAVANGGTGATTAANARLNLGAAATSHTHAAADITSGVLATARIPDLDASQITTGVFAVARLGTGTGTSAKYLRGDGIWTTFPSIPGGTVTSVAASGGSTGLTFTGSPITTSGTLTMSGVLSITNGGTGSSSAAGARANLGLYVQSADPGAVADGSVWMW